MAKNKINTTTLENQVEKLREICEFRNEYFDDKSESWQDSEKGEMYAERTTDLESIIDDLESAVNELMDWNDTL